MAGPVPAAHRRSRLAGSAAIVGGILLAAFLAGCTPSAPVERSASSSTDPSPVAPAEGEESTSSPCELLPDATIESLLGDVPKGVEVTVPGSDLRACQFGDITRRGIQVTHAPASEWAASLPGIVDQLSSLPEGAVDDAVLDQLADASELIAAGATISGEEACTYFSSLLELRGQAPGSAVTVVYYPNRESAMAVTGQQCIDGAYSSLLVGRPGLSDDPAIVEQVTTALTQLG